MATLTKADADREALIKRIMVDLTPMIEQTIRAALCQAEYRIRKDERDKVLTQMAPRPAPPGGQ